MRDVDDAACEVSSNFNKYPMGKPASTIIMSQTDPQYRRLDVLDAPALYAVCLDGQHIGLREINELAGLTRYRQTVYPNLSYAIQRRDRLNERFRTDRFHVRVVALGEGVAKHLESETRT